jgi:hypothetical protein
MLGGIGQSFVDREYQILGVLRWPPDSGQPPSQLSACPRGRTRVYRQVKMQRPHETPILFAAVTRR